MRTRLGSFVLFLVAVLFAVPAQAQTPKVEIFGGYSYLRVDADGTGINLNGWHASLTGNVNRWFGVTGEISGHYGSQNILGTPVVDGNVYSFLFGPRVSLRANDTVTPFAHVLIGGVRVGADIVGTNLSDTSLAGAFGAGIDVRLSRHVAWRLVQADLLITNLGDSSANSAQKNVRISSGIVLRFGD